MDSTTAINTGLFVGFLVGLISTGFLWWTSWSTGKAAAAQDRFNAADLLLKNIYPKVAYSAFSEFLKARGKRTKRRMNQADWYCYFRLFKHLGFPTHSEACEELERIHGKISGEFHGRVRFAGWDSYPLLECPPMTYWTVDKKGNQASLSATVDQVSAELTSWRQSIFDLSPQIAALRIFYPDGELFVEVSRTPVQAA